MPLKSGRRVLVYHALGLHPGRNLLPPPHPPKLTPHRERRLLEQEKEALRKLAGEFPGVVIAVENARPYLFHSPYCYSEKLDSLKEAVEPSTVPMCRSPWTSATCTWPLNFILLIQSRR